MPGLLLACLVLIMGGLTYARPALGDGADIEFGGWGHGHGKFMMLRGFCFGPHQRIYVLDGSAFDNTTRKLVGNRLVQIFTSKGHFLRQFPIVASPRLPTPLHADPTAGMKNFTNFPQRIAVSAHGNIFITQPWAEAVQEYAPTGRLLRAIPVPYAMAITCCRYKGKPCVAVIGSESATTPSIGKVPGRGWHWVGGHRITFINAGTGAPVGSVALSRRLTDVQDMTVDKQGNFYVEAATHQIYKFNPHGRLLLVIGAGTSTRRTDGSELYRTVAVDGQGNIYSMTMGGNPEFVTRFNPQLTLVTQRGGQFHWADSWSYAGHRTPMVIGPQDRLWVASTGHRATPSPVIMRMDKNYLSSKLSQVRVHSALTLGLYLSTATALPYNVGYQLQPTIVDLHIRPATRRVHQVAVQWAVYNLYKRRIGHGVFTFDLHNQKAAVHSISFTPPQWGWYTAVFSLSHQGRPLSSTGCDIGFTPAYKGMPILKKGQSPGGWFDPLRQVFCGLPLMRFGIGPDMKGLSKKLALAAKDKAKVFGQFTNVRDCTPACVRAAVAKLKNQVNVWEIMNEPNFSMNPVQYVALIKKLYPLIKSIDPQARVMGPAVCGIQLPWYRQFLALGGGRYINILSLHDYEGNTSIGPAHWRYKFAALHKMMRQYGVGNLPIWQTERDIGGVRGGLFWGGTQAVRITLHEDLLTTLGVPSDHDMLYYLNNSGYGAVPSYVWSNHGPFPAAMATRTRQAMIQGRKYTGSIDFGPSGRRLLLGLRYHGKHGQTIILRNLGATTAIPVKVRIAGAGPVTVVDAFGNRQTIAVHHGLVILRTSTMPIYLRLHKHQKANFPRFDFGANDAAGAKLAYSAKNNGLFSTLTNGVFGSIYPGDPTTGKFFTGSLPSIPQTFSITLTQPRTINRVLVYSVHADNPYCALLDYNLQYRHDHHWITIKKMRTPCPRSTPVHTGATKVDGWYLDQNFSMSHFSPITAQRLRLVILRTTWGFMPDKTAAQITHFVPNHPHLMLRQIDIYGPHHPNVRR